MARSHDGTSIPGSRGRILHLAHETSGFLRPTGLSVCMPAGRGPRFARFRGLQSRAIRLPIANGGRLEAVGLRWSFAGEGVADVLLLGN